MTEHTKPETLKTEFVSPDSCCFFETEFGFLGVKIGDKTYRRVILTRALPLSAPNRYICISDVDKKEIGIIERADAFSAEQQTLINKELSLRYFCPVITEIISIKEKMGHFYFEVKISNQKKSFTVRDISKSVRLFNGDVTITDMDANRYRIPDFASIPHKSRRILEPYIY